MSTSSCKKKCGRSSSTQFSTSRPASARHQSITRICTGSIAQPGFNCLAGTNTVTGATYGDATFSKATGKLALDCKLSDSQLLYATVSTIFNAAKAKTKGLEAELEWRQSRDLTLGGSLSLLDAKYASFPDVALPFGTSILVADPTSAAPQTDANGIVIAPAGQKRLFAPGYNCAVVPGTGGAGQPAAAFGCDLTGKRLPYAARYHGSVFARYDIQLASGCVLTPTLVATFFSGFFGQPSNAEIERQGAYGKTDFKLNWRLNDTFALQAFVDNISDKQTINRFVWGGGGGLQVSAAPPRTFGLKLSYSSF